MEKEVDHLRDVVVGTLFRKNVKRSFYHVQDESVGPIAVLIGLKFTCSILFPSMRCLNYINKAAYGNSLST